MRRLELSINAGIGDHLIVRVFFDTIKNNYDQISVSHNRVIVDYWKDGDPNYYAFLNELGNLFFTSPPYLFEQRNVPTTDVHRLTQTLQIIPQKPDLDHLLCKGTPLNLAEEYIVITTKIRGIDRKTFYPLSIQLWRTLNQLAQRYKIVILGEKEVEMNKEYTNNRDIIFGIYDQIITNLPANRLVDLTIPALGKTTPNLSQIQQDCLIMKDAKFVLTLAVGGNFWLALSVANTIGFRSDVDSLNDMLINPRFPSLFISQNWGEFINKLASYR